MVTTRGQQVASDARGTRSCRTMNNINKAPITTTPTDVVAYIAKHYLDIKDVCNLRQTCIWAEHETFTSFAAQGYRCIQTNPWEYYYERPARDVRSFEVLKRVVLRSKHLAASVKTLVINELDKEAEQIPSFLLLNLPNLEELESCFMTSETYAKSMQLWLQHTEVSANPSLTIASPDSAPRPRLTSLTLYRCDLVSADLLSLLHAVTPTVSELVLSCCVSRDNNWVRIFELIHDSMVEPKSVFLGCLSHIAARDGRRETVRLRDGDGDGNSAKWSEVIQGAQGTEMISGYGWHDARMEGKRAVNIGLERILKHLASQEGTRVQ